MPNTHAASESHITEYVTAMIGGQLFGLPKRETERPPMAVGVDLRGESYGLLIDSVGEVLKLADDSREVNPVNLDPRLTKMAAGIHRLDGQLMVVLDVDRVLEIVPDLLAA